MKHEAVPDATLWELIHWLARRRWRLHVVGESMLPTLAPDDTVFVDQRAYRTCTPSAGDVIAALHPLRANLPIVKRVAFVEDDGACYLLSDNAAAGSDSRSFGPVSLGSILGRVTSRIVA